jgi:hypothetical protein
MEPPIVERAPGVTAARARETCEKRRVFRLAPTAQR